MVVIISALETKIQDFETMQTVLLKQASGIDKSVFFFSGKSALKAIK